MKEKRKSLSINGLFIQIHNKILNQCTFKMHILHKLQKAKTIYIIIFVIEKTQSLKAEYKLSKKQLPWIVKVRVLCYVGNSAVQHQKTAICSSVDDGH
jgi:hypothetical protein